MFRGTTNLTTRGVLVFAAMAVLAGCDGDGTGPDDHREAAGMVITNQNNTVLASVNAARQVTGSLTVQAGQGQHLDIYFLDEDGDRFQLEEGDEHTLEWTVANENIAMIDSHEGHHDLDGVAAGSTTVVFTIMHGNHSDYDSPAIPITVTP